MTVLQESTNRTIGKKTYVQYSIVISPKKIEKLGWKKGERLDVKVRGKSLVVKRASTD